MRNIFKTRDWNDRAWHCQQKSELNIRKSKRQSEFVKKLAALWNCWNINLWVPLCGVPYIFVGCPTSRGHVSWLMLDIVLTVFNVALSLLEPYLELSFNMVSEVKTFQRLQGVYQALAEWQPAERDSRTPGPLVLDVNAADNWRKFFT